MNKILKTWMLVLMFLVVTSTVSAIGVSPARKTIFYEPGMQGSFDIRILNNEFKDMKVKIYTEGDLKDIITFSKDKVEIGRGGKVEISKVLYFDDVEMGFDITDESKKLTYNFELSNNLEKPGIHEIKIFAQEVPRSGDGETVVGAVGAVAHQFHIIVPYPGKYLEAELRISETALGEPVTFVIPVRSMGYDDINSVKGVLEIFDSSNNLVGTVETNEISLKSKAKSELVALWDAIGVEPGIMKAKLTVHYDGKTANVEKTFNFGQVLLDLIYMVVRDFRLGEIAKFDTLVENKWSELVENVYVETIFFDKFGDEVNRFKTPTENFEGGARKELVGYMDTIDMEIGVYDLKVLLFYEDKFIEKHLRALVSLNSIEIGFFGATAQAVSVQSGLKKNTLIMFLILIIIAANIGWYIYFRRRHKVKEGKTIKK